MNTLAINFNGPSVTPGNGYQVQYRPKGSTLPYYSFTQTTGSPIKITANILSNVDYEGTMQSLCVGSSSPARSFVTSNYSNAVGNITVGTCAVPATIGSITGITFNSIALLPLLTAFPVVQSQTSSFVSNSKGIFSLVITHTFLAGTVVVADSSGASYTQTITAGSNTFPLITINELLTFSVTVTC